MPAQETLLKLSTGACVRHLKCSDWGLGLVLSLRAGNKVDVYFERHPSNAVVTLKADPSLIRLSKTAPTPPLIQYRDRLFTPVKKSKHRNKAPPPPPEITHQEAVRRFLALFPRGFRDDAYIEQERNYKMAAHSIFADGLPARERAKLLKSGEVANLIDRLQYIEGKTNLLSPFEKARLRDGLRDHRTAMPFLGALFAMLDAPVITEAHFNALARSIEALPAPRGRVDTWPIATIFPFLAQPDRHMFLKPIVTKAAAARVGIDLFYEANLNWKTYSQTLELGRVLLKELAPYGCRDMIDVQSFVWRIE
jgi:hypothetical protein